MRNGVVTDIDRDQIKIRMANGEEKTYYLSPATIAQRQGQSVNIDTLYRG